MNTTQLTSYVRPNCARPNPTRSPRTIWILAPILCLFLAESLLAHGQISTPASRVYKCRFEDNPENPMNPACAAAVAFAGNPQFLYDWAGIRQADANGQHQQVVPNGEICSGGGSEYGGLDLTRDDWSATFIEPDGNGNFEFIYHASAPHSTQDMLFYITPEGWDPSQPLTWENLDFVDEPGNPNDPVDAFCHLTAVTLETIPGVGEGYRMVCPLPVRTGRHVIFNVWQRDDSPEAFYGCVDVLMGESGVLFEDDFETGDDSVWSDSVP